MFLTKTLNITTLMVYFTVKRMTIRFWLPIQMLMVKNTQYLRELMKLIIMLLNPVRTLRQFICRNL